MSQSLVSPASQGSLTGLLVPLSDRTLLLPNVAVAELIPYQAPHAVQGAPAWLLGQVAWRELSLPLLSFEAASSNRAAPLGSATRVAVLNALGGRGHLRFIALLVQGIPHSIKVDASLARAEVPLDPLELDAVNLGDVQARIPDLLGLEQKLADAGLI